MMFPRRLRTLLFALLGSFWFASAWSPLPANAGPFRLPVLPEYENARVVAGTMEIATATIEKLGFVVGTDSLEIVYASLGFSASSAIQASTATLAVRVYPVTLLSSVDTGSSDGLDGAIKFLNLTAGTQTSSQLTVFHPLGFNTIAVDNSSLGSVYVQYFLLVK